MLRTVYSTCALFVILCLITGGLYPLVVTICAQAIFPGQARGSVIEQNGTPIGSDLIGQTFEREEYFWGRPSAANNNAAGSTGSNFGPTNPALLALVKERVGKLRATSETPIPVDLATASASGLDPHITPAAAHFQVTRVAKARGVPDETIRAIVNASMEERSLGILGERRVNVLRLNLALDEKVPVHP